MQILSKGRTWVLVFILLISSCTTLQTFIGSDSTSPREHYLKSLEKSDLVSTPMARTWIQAGDVAKHDSILVALPFAESGFFASSELQARFYRFDAQEGQVLTVNTAIKSKENAQLFIDVFSLKDGQWKATHHADSLSLTHEFLEDGSCIVRLQPELLVNMYYSVSLSVTPVLINPVQGASNKSIRSFYGDARDGGARKHEGVDIFAPKGTLVVAPTDGTVTSVGFNSLGGKVVWMNDTRRRHSYYFAHLDSQIVKPGTRVYKGDALGTVGNTGNARRTPSHLHFGVYEKNAKDPVSYIRTMEQLVDKLMPDTLFQSLVFKVNQKTTPLYSGPGKKQPVTEQLVKDNWLKVVAQSNEWYRVMTADNREGFIEKKKVAPAEKGKTIWIKKEIPLLTEASDSAIPIGTFTGNAEKLAVFENFIFVKTTTGITCWINSATL